MAEFGPDLKSQLELNTSYMDYLEDARFNIDQCRYDVTRVATPQPVCYVTVRSGIGTLLILSE